MLLPIIFCYLLLALLLALAGLLLEAPSGLLGLEALADLVRIGAGRGPLALVVAL